MSSDPLPGDFHRLTSAGVEIHLDVAGSQLTAVSMNVYRGRDGDVTPVISKDIAVGTPPVLTAFTGALTAGDYEVTFDATTSDGTLCIGTRDFTVVADTISETQLDLVCSVSVCRPHITSSSFNHGDGDGTRLRMCVVAHHRRDVRAGVNRPDERGLRHARCKRDVSAM